MSKQASKAFKVMIDICYEADFPELHTELSFLESETKKTNRYETGMEEIFDLIYIFSTGFPSETLIRLENVFQEYLDNK